MEELVVESIGQALKDTHPEVRCRAARILGAIGNKQATDLLKGALNDEDLDVRGVARYALKRIRRDETHQQSCMYSNSCKQCPKTLRKSRCGNSLKTDKPFI